MKRLGVVAAVLFSGFARAGDAPNAAVEALKKDVGAYGWRVLEAATAVEVSSPGATPVRGKDQGEEFSKRLRQAIVEGQDAHSTEEKECKFEPQVSFRFVSGTDHVGLQLDFACEKMEFECADPKAPAARSAHRYFGDSRAAFVRLAQEALPDDKVVQGLKAWNQDPDAKALKEIGVHASQVLMAAEKVEVYRIKPDKGDPKAAERQIAGGYPVISQGPDRGPAFAARIASLLLFGRTQAGFDKHCSFEPGVVFVVKSKDDHVDLVLCFTCDELVTQAFPPKAPAAVNGQFDMDGSLSGWMELAKQGLPADETIQGLSQKPK